MKTKRIIVLVFLNTVFPLQIIQGPQVGNNMQAEFTVGWQTDSLCDSRLEWGLSVVDLPQNVSKDSLRRWHVLKATGLSAQTCYYYRVVSRRGNDTVRSDVYRTKTAVLRDTPFRFEIVTDPHGGAEFSRTYNGNPATRYFASKLLQQDSADFFMGTGDLVGTNSNPNQDSCFAMILNYKKNLDTLEHSVPVYECFGNHDGGTDMIWANTDTADFGFILPETSFYADSSLGKGHFYSFDYGTAHFVAADWNESTNQPGALAWIISDLQAARARGQEHVFFFSHYPLLDFGWGTNYAIHADRWWSGSYYRGCASNMYHALDSLGAEAWFFGHWHNYCRYRIHPGTYPGFDTLWAKENFRNQVLFLSNGHFGGGGYDVDTANYTEDFYSRAYSTMVVQCDVDFRQTVIRGINQWVNWSGTPWSKTAIDSFALRPFAPVNLAAIRRGGAVELSWDRVNDSVSIHGVGGYRVYRSGKAYGDLRNTSQSQYEMIGTLASADSTLFVDSNPGGSAYYVVAAYDTNYAKRQGNYSNEASPDHSAGEFMGAAHSPCISARPNPFTSNIQVHITPGLGVLELAAYDIRGRKVADLKPMLRNSRVSWNPNLPAGLYCLRVVMGRKVHVKSLLLVK